MDFVSKIDFNISCSLILDSYSYKPGRFFIKHFCTLTHTTPSQPPPHRSRQVKNYNIVEKGTSQFSQCEGDQSEGDDL